jgi:hypothetical protein
MFVQGTEQRPGEHVADDGEQLHAFTLDRVPEEFRIEPGPVDEHDGAAPRQHRQRGEESGAVHEGRRGQHGGRALAGPGGGHGIGRGGPVGVGRGPEPDVEIVVAPHDAFGHTGGSAGVQEHEVVAVRGAGVPFRVAGSGRQRGLVGVARFEEHGSRRLGNSSSGLADHRGEFGPVHARLGVGVVEHVVDLVDLVAEVDVARHATELQRRVEGLQVLVPVGEVDRDLVTRPEAGSLLQVPGEASGALGELAPGDAALAAHDGVTVGDRLGDPVPASSEVPPGHEPRLDRGFRRVGGRSVGRRGRTTRR